jgi:hypothetical protein
MSRDDKEEIRTLIREELRAIAAEQQQRGAAPESPAPSEESKQADLMAALTAQQLAHYDQSKNLIAAGLARGTWTQADRDQLHERFNDVPGDLRMELVRPLIVAANRGKLKFEGVGPIF